MPKSTLTTTIQPAPNKLKLKSLTNISGNVTSFCWESEMLISSCKSFDFREIYVNSFKLPTTPKLTDETISFFKNLEFSSPLTMLPTELESKLPMDYTSPPNYELLQSLESDPETQFLMSNLNNYYNVKSILSKYQEQPTLLDPHLKLCISPLISSALYIIPLELSYRNSMGINYFDSPLIQVISPFYPLLNTLCSLLYLFCKTRGTKTILHFVPHSVDILNPLLQILLSECQKYNINKSTMYFDSPDSPAISSSSSKIISQNYFGSLEHLNTWAIRFSLLSWLSLVVLIPFSLNTVLRPIQIQALLETCSAFLGDTGPCRTASSSLLSNFLTRPDTIGLFLGPFISWSSTLINSRQHEYSSWTITGVFETLILIFKAGFPSELKEWLRMIFTALSICPYKSSSIEKSKMELYCQLAMVILPKRPLPWIYSRGKRKLFGENGSQNKDSQTVSQDSSHLEMLAAKSKNGKYSAKAVAVKQKIMLLNDQKQVSQNVINSSTSQLPTFENQNVDTIIDNIVDILLGGLSSSDSIVRWASAKALGQITSRLSQEYALDIIHALFGLVSNAPLEKLNQLSYYGSSKLNQIYLTKLEPLQSLPFNLWEGWCLGIAELCRRGCVFVQFLPWILQLSSFALFYETRKGSRSIGTNVRDASCYLSWSLSRAFEPHDLEPYAFQLASNLLVVTALDSQTQCRRAGSAAFQENVGRCKHFPHGIPLLAITDYYSVGSLKTAFTKTAVTICRKYPIYREPILRRLVTFTSFHWEPKVARTAHKTCSILAKMDITIFDQFLPFLCQSLVDSSSSLSQTNAISVLLAILVGHFENIREIKSITTGPASGVTCSTYDTTSFNPQIKSDQISPTGRNVLLILAALYPHYRMRKLFRGAPGLHLRIAISNLIWVLASNIINLDSLFEDLLKTISATPFFGKYISYQNLSHLTEISMYTQLLSVHFRKHLEANLRHESLDLHLKTYIALKALVHNI